MKSIAICLIVGASLTITNHSFGQIRLGAVSNTRLSAAASVNTPAMNNALRAGTTTVKSTTVATKAVAQQTVSTTDHAAVRAANTVGQVKDKVRLCRSLPRSHFIFCTG